MTIQVQARALGDPTRYEIFRYIADSADGAYVAELTDHCGLNHNAIRQHLAKLLDARLVVEQTEKTGGRGRPRLVYRVDPGTESRWGVVGPYERLSVLLTEIIRSGDDPVTVGRRAGTDAVERQRPPTAPGTEPIDATADDLVAQMATQGFAPTLRQRESGPEVVLHTCPFETAALTDQNTVCGLHLGLAQGLTEGTDLRVEELVRRDPRRAKCLLRLVPAET